MGPPADHSALLRSLTGGQLATFKAFQENVKPALEGLGVDVFIYPWRVNSRTNTFIADEVWEHARALQESEGVEWLSKPFIVAEYKIDRLEAPEGPRELSLTHSGITQKTTIIRK